MQNLGFLIDGGNVFGGIAVGVDALSLWFMAIICLVFVAGALYGTDYMKHYLEHSRALVLHIVSYVVCFLSMLALCVLRNALAFLVAWELMALSSFILIIFESWKKETVEAGANFFIQSHISVALLTAGFLGLAAKCGSYDFDAMSAWCHSAAGARESYPFFLLLIAGFAVKAGFVPFHTWLPRAHPAAPAHISGVMSGVIIKIGIYGILRSISLFNPDMMLTGCIILAVSAISGLYGVMLAIVQHNLKKLLAYHSIENIGIIGMGIGVGCIGAGMGSSVLAGLGFCGALLHTLNHALFKSSLFFTAGNVYHAAHTLDIEHLGGLVKKLPATAAFFLIAAVAICGLPPMNGFVSELLIYMGLFDWMGSASATAAVGAAFAILALVMIGGLAILCFTKAFGIVFLGSARSELPEMKEFGLLRTLPLGVMAMVMLSIGLFPQFYLRMVSDACLAVFPGASVADLPIGMGKVSIAAIALAALILILLGVKKLVNSKRTIASGPTWGCGYTAATPRIQYTATSFVKTYADMFTGLLGFHKEYKPVEGIYPQERGSWESENYDRIETGLIERPLGAYRRLMDRFSFLQNGHLQMYILYGIICIVVTILLTFIFV